ncbi:MAG: rhodanese-like domain-containing protein [Planctomycetota bacterium]|nr:rhodanese-like domain-containing protein [Planctomycetota bacterium]
MTMTSASRTAPTGALQPVPADAAIAAQAEPREVRRWLQSGECVLLDVREADEHARERIAGAKLLPLSKFDPAHAASMVRAGQKLVVHCRSGRRSADACRLAASLAASGVQVVNMTGGIEAWKKDALPVEVDSRVSGISVMRQVQLVIGVGVLGGSALAWFVDPRFVALPAFFGAGLTFAGATGTCALATLIGKMPWNRAKTGGSCSTGTCG